MNNESISEKEISKTVDEFNSLNETEVNKLFEELVKEQPAITAFMVAIAESLNEEDSRSFLFELSIIVYLVYKKKYKQVKKIPIEEVERIDDEENGRMEEIEQSAIKDEQLNENIINEAMKMIFDNPEPALSGFIFQSIGEYYELDDEDDFSITGMNENINDNPNELDAGIISGAMNVITECFHLAVSKPLLKIVR